MYITLITITDHSSRRGVLVAMLKSIYALIADNAQKRKATPPDNFITWQHVVKPQLLDISRRFFSAMDGDILVGVFFYRYSDGNIYIEELQIAHSYRNNPQILEGFLKKLESDQNAASMTFYANDRMQQEQNKEILATVGIKQEFENGWECLGTFTEMSNALKLRY